MTPIMATPTADIRCAGVTLFRAVDPKAGTVTLVAGTPSALLLVTGEGEGELEKREVGRAIRKTPKRETRPAICSVRVNGSWRRVEQTQQATIGARKVITVASAMGR